MAQVHQNSQKKSTKTVPPAAQKKDANKQDASFAQNVVKLPAPPPAPPVVPVVQAPIAANVQGEVRQPAHMAKVNKLANQLPELSGDAKTLFVGMQNLSTADLTSLQAHINVEIRRRGVLNSVSANVAADGPLQVGERVRVVGGTAKFLSLEGTVTRVARIRCYVRLDGRDRDDYFFIADVERLNVPVTPEAVAQTVARLTQAPPAVTPEVTQEVVAAAAEVPVEETPAPTPESN